MNRKHLPVSYDCTHLERAALRAIAESEYHDCGPLDAAIVGNHVWSGYDYLGGGVLTSRNIAGVLSSLAQKHLATFGVSDGMPTAALTEHGWACYKAHFHPQGSIRVAMLPAATDNTLAQLVAGLTAGRAHAVASSGEESPRVLSIDVDLATLRAEQEHRAALAREVASSESVPL